MNDLGLSDEEQTIVKTIADFVDKKVRPVAHELESENVYPAELIDEMKYLGVFGLCVPPPYGDVHVSTACYALVTEELSRGWMSLAGAVGGHSVVCRLINEFGTPEQKETYLGRMATGEVRGAMALTEPSGGSDLQAMRSVAKKTARGWVINGSKVWITNARRAGVTALLCKTDPTATPPHSGMSIILVEPGPGFTVSRDLSKLGYKGIESCELLFEDYLAGPGSLLGGEPGDGFPQMMRGLELGRIQVAARAVGVARAALEDSVSYAQQRESFGRPIWQHQSIGNYLADMATRVEASRLLTLSAARKLDEGIRSDMEAGMAKLFASESCMEISLMAMRIHGGYGYSNELEIQRYFRDAPLMIIGEGTNEIQRQVIARQLISRNLEATGRSLHRRDRPEQPPATAATAATEPAP